MKSLSDLQCLTTEAFALDRIGHELTHGSGECRDTRAGRETPVHAIRDEPRGPGGAIGTDDRRTHSHALQHDVRKTLEARGLHDQTRTGHPFRYCRCLANEL